MLLLIERVKKAPICAVPQRRFVRKISRLSRVFALFFGTLLFSSAGAQTDTDPWIEPEWLVETLQRQEAPRLIWRQGLEDRVREAVAQDPAAAAFYGFILRQADEMLELPALERELTGRRLLSVSRNGLKRIAYLSFSWRLTGDRRYLQRLEQTLESVSAFSDWNPSHFLDTAEMSLGVSLALDWAGDAMDPEVAAWAKQALFEHGLKTGLDPAHERAFMSRNNWNQVCNAGIVAAALVLAEDYPAEAAQVISRMIEHLPTALETYGPDGVYIEGAMYWSYGTQFSVVMLDMLETALGTRFGLEAAPGFMESADFVHLIKAPSGFYFDFYDSNKGGGYMDGQAWFAKETGQPRYLQREQVLAFRDRDLPASSPSGRLLPVEFIWFLQYREASERPLPLNWVGRGENPIGVFRTRFDDVDALYLAFKGGKGTNGHGNMDAGSFILERDGVRWAIDPGNQGYADLEAYFEERGGNLWSSEQESVRWELLTKNNFGHSTLTLGGALHSAGGLGEIVAFDAETRTATLDLTEPLGVDVAAAERTFMVPDERVVEITDRIAFAAEAKEVTWQLMTQAEVKTRQDGALLKQARKTLSIQILEPNGAVFSVISLQTPPHPADKRMEGLKRLELTVPAHAIEAGEARIRVRLGGR